MRDLRMKTREKRSVRQSLDARRGLQWPPPIGPGSAPVSNWTYAPTTGARSPHTGRASVTTLSRIEATSHEFVELGAARDGRTSFARG
jgi:hypothetical protein